MKTFCFKIAAVQTHHGTAYFSVEAETEDEAMALLNEDASEYFDEFNEETGETTWDESEGFEAL
jgi:hypothetical protein